MLTTTDLGPRLRHETADAHRTAEAVTGLPRTVSSVPEYAALLRLLWQFHTHVETTLAAPRWRTDWARVGIVPSEHDRSGLIAADLSDLHVTVKSETRVSQPLVAASFGGALGILYVVEGSSLGGLLLGPLLREALGLIPTRFYDGDSRAHPRPWRSVQAALSGYDAAGGDHDEVIDGARHAFETFGSRLASPLWSSVR
jgi:heme oxygenase